MSVNDVRLSNECRPLLRAAGMLLLAALVTQCRTPVTPEGAGTIDPALRMLIDDADGVARLQDQSARDALAFQVDVAGDGTVVIPVFVDTKDPAATADAIRAGGGTVSLMMPERLIARLPVSAVRSIGARQEVVRIEPSWKRRG